MNFKNKYIIIADDDFSIRKRLELILTKNNFKCKIFETGHDLIKELENNHKNFGLILLDVTMEDLNGFEIAKRIRETPLYKDIPIIFITGNTDIEDKKKGFEAGCVDYITKPFDNNEVIMRVQLHLELSYRREEALNYAKDLELKVMERTQEINLVRKALIVSLSTLAESRDPETGKHILRTSEYARLLAIELTKIDKYKEIIYNNFIERIYDCAPLHDIGKVGISDNILLKKDRLTTEEFAIMKTHTIIGYNTLISSSNLISNNSFLIFAAEIAKYHHERYDGNGYPEGLKGDNIPLHARIMALADVFDALITKRPYKDPWPFEKVKEYIVNNSGKHFDPDIVNAFLNLEEKFIEINNKYRD